MKTEYPPELREAVAKAAKIYNKNSQNIAAYARELDIISGYLKAKEEVSRLQAEYLANTENK